MGAILRVRRRANSARSRRPDAQLPLLPPSGPRTTPVAHGGATVATPAASGTVGRTARAGTSTGRAACAARCEARCSRSGAAESGHQHEEQHEIQCSQSSHLSSSRSSGSARQFTTIAAEQGRASVWPGFEKLLEGRKAGVRRGATTHGRFPSAAPVGHRGRGAGSGRARATCGVRAAGCPCAPRWRGDEQGRGCWSRRWPVKSHLGRRARRTERRAPS